MTYLLFVLGLVALFFGGEYLVRGASGIARRYNLSPLVIGLTIVGFGTSAPELLVSVQAALAGQPALAIGNVLGSNQSGGRSSLKLLRVATDGDLILDARVAAAEVREADASLRGHPALMAALARRLDDRERDFLAKN